MLFLGISHMHSFIAMGMNLALVLSNPRETAGWMKSDTYYSPPGTLHVIFLVTYIRLGERIGCLPSIDIWEMLLQLHHFNAFLLHYGWNGRNIGWIIQTVFITQAFVQREAISTLQINHSILTYSVHLTLPIGYAICFIYHSQTKAGHDLLCVV